MTTEVIRVTSEMIDKGYSILISALGNKPRPVSVYETRVVLEELYREMRALEPEIEEPHDFDAQSWKRWMFG